MLYPEDFVTVILNDSHQHRAVDVDNRESKVHLWARSGKATVRYAVAALRKNGQSWQHARRLHLSISTGQSLTVRPGRVDVLVPAAHGVRVGVPVAVVVVAGWEGGVWWWCAATVDYAQRGCVSRPGTGRSPRCVSNQSSSRFSHPGPVLQGVALYGRLTAECFVAREY